MSSTVRFGRKKWFRLPFTSRYKEVEEKEALSLLKDGKKIGVAPEHHSSEFVPIKSQQDWAEVQTFIQQQVQEGVEEPELAKNLIALAQEDVVFRNDNGQRIGAYGLYNLLTEELDGEFGELAFYRLDNIPVKDASEFEGLLKKRVFAEQMMQEVPQRFQSKFEACLYESMRLKPEAQSPKELAEAALEGNTSTLRWSIPDEELHVGYISKLSEYAGASPERAALATALSQRMRRNGYRAVPESSVLEMHRLAANEDLTDREFLLKSLELPEVRGNARTLGHHALKTLFPAELAISDKLLDASTPEARQDRQIDFVAKALQDPSLIAKIETVIANPLSQEADEIREELRQSLDSENTPSKLVNALELSALRERTGEKHPSIALAALSVQTGDGSLSIASAQARRVIIDAAKKGELSSQEFTNEVLEGVTDAHESNALKTVLLEHLFPDRSRTIGALLEHSHLENNTELTTILSDALLAEGNLSNPGALLESALKHRTRNASGQDITELHRVIAVGEAQENERAKLFVRTADSLEHYYRDDSDERVDIQRLIYKAASQPRLSDDEALEKVLEETELDPRYRSYQYVQREIGERLFPELAQKAEGLALYASREHSPEVWSYVFNALRKNPKQNNMATLARDAAESVPEDEFELANAVRAVGLLASSDKNEKAQQALEIVRGPMGQRRLDSQESVAAVYLGAVQSHRSELEHLFYVLERASHDDRNYLIEQLAKDSFQELELTIPPEQLHAFKNGEVSVSELKEMIAMVGAKILDETTSVEIKIEDDLILVGNESLEVDL